MKKPIIFAWIICGLLILLLVIVPLAGHPIIKKNIGGNYYRDFFRIYHYTAKSCLGWFGCSYYYEPVVGADVSSFTYREGGLAVDDNHVYCGQRMDDIDLQSFRKLDHPFYTDEDNLLRGCTLTVNDHGKFDIDSFEYLDCGIYKDKNGVYVIQSGGDSISYKNDKYSRVVDVYAKLEYLDSATVQVHDDCRMTDKNHDLESDIKVREEEWGYSITESGGRGSSYLISLNEVLD